MCYSLWCNAPTSCNTQSSAHEDGKNNCPKYVELIGIINKPLLLNLVGCLHYLCTHILQGGSNMTGTDLCVNKLHCAAAVLP